MPPLLKRRWFWPLVLFALTFAAYHQTYRFEYVWDDHSQVSENYALRSWKNLPRFFTDPASYSSDGSIEVLYRPVRSVSFLIDATLFDLRPGPAHLENAILHGSTAVLLFYLVLSLLGCEAQQVRCFAASFFGAFIWAIHPVCSEPVAWVKCRDDILCTLFFTGSLFLFVRMIIRLRSSPLHLAGMAILLLLALLSKEMAVALPLVQLAAWLALRKAHKISIPFRRVIIPLTLSVCLTLLFIGVRHTVLGRTEQIGYITGSFHSMMATMTRAFVRYIQLAVWPTWPTQLIADYSGYSYSASFLELRVIVSLMLLALVFILAIICWRKAPIAAFGITLFAVALLPVSNIIPTMQVMAERFMYLPLTGIAFIVAWAVIHPRIAPRLSIAAVSLYAVALLITLQLRLPVWANQLNLYSDSYRALPMWRQSSNYITALADSRRYDEVVHLSDDLLAKWPESATILTARGIALTRLEREQEGVNLMLRAAQLDSSSAIPYRRLAEYYLGKRQMKPARDHYLLAAKREPSNPAYWFNVAAAEYRLKNYPAARFALSRTHQIHPRYDGVSELTKKITIAEQTAKANPGRAK